jgi:hypothetical protein
VNYRISEAGGWIIVSPSGKAQNNEPLRVKYLFKRWLAQEGLRVIVALKEVTQFGVWEMGLITSFKKELDQRAGALRLGHLNPVLQGYFQSDRSQSNPRLIPISRAQWQVRGVNAYGSE